MALICTVSCTQCRRKPTPNVALSHVWYEFGYKVRIVALSHHLVGCIHFLLEGCYRTKTKTKKKNSDVNQVQFWSILGRWMLSQTNIPSLDSVQHINVGTWGL